MNAKTQLLLYHLLWTAETMTRPTYRNLNESFEGWAYRNGFIVQIQRLQAKGYVEYGKSALDERQFLRLTNAGRLAAIGGRDPQSEWERPWNKKWQLILFDIPMTRSQLRRKLNRSLTSMGFGCLQGSVWIAPHRSDGDLEFTSICGDDCSHLIALEADSRGIKIDRQMVASAWNFKRINKNYQSYMEIVGRFPFKKAGDWDALLKWSKLENQEWLEAVGKDPLLPKALLPPGYLGRNAWLKRCRILQNASAMASAKPD